jgi:hypothetical protein
VENVAHEKIKSFFVMLAVFGCVGVIGWAVVQSHANSEVFPSLTPSPQVLTLDELQMAKVSHPPPLLFAVSPSQIPFLWKTLNSPTVHPVEEENP